MRRSLTVTVLTALLVALFASPAAAATPVFVEDHTGSAWPVNYSQGFVDTYTGSDIVYGACRTGYTCVRVYERTIRSDWAGVTCLPAVYCAAATTSYTRIYLNPQRRSYSWAARRNITTHELGHAFGIGYHSAYCTNVMWGGVFCPGGSLPAYRFTDPQKTILRQH